MRTVFARSGPVLLACLATTAVLVPSLYILSTWRAAWRQQLDLQCDEHGCSVRPARGRRGAAHAQTQTPAGSAEDPLYQVNDQDIYIYAAYYDDRFDKRMIRVIGMQSTRLKDRIFCRFYYDGGKLDSPVDATFPIYSQWPSLDLQLHAFYYQCRVPEVPQRRALYLNTVTLLVSGSMVETRVPISHAPAGPASPAGQGGPGGPPQQPRPALAVCVKALWGRLEPARLVEWIEMNSLLGVEKIFIYDGTVLGPAQRVLRHYQDKGIVEVIPYKFLLHMMTITKEDKVRVPLTADTMYMEQAFLVSMNDCLYRNRKRFRYIAILDTDEVIVPRLDEPLVRTVQRALAEFPHAAGLGFNTAWHLAEFGPAAVDQDVRQVPLYLHMQRHMRRSPVLKSQPKTVFLTDRFITVNWHSVVMMPSHQQLTGNEFLPHRKYGEVHHYRRTCKYGVARCDLLRNTTMIDQSTSRYYTRLEHNVRHALQDLIML